MSLYRFGQVRVRSLLVLTLIGSLAGGVWWLGGEDAGGRSTEAQPALTTPALSGRMESGPGLTQLSGEITNGKWEPSAIFNDGLDSSLLTVSLSGGTFETVWITAAGVLDADANAPNIPASLANLADGLVQLFDDGSNGDATASDGVYSRLVTASGALTHDGGTHQQLDAELFFFEGLATGVRINVIGGLAVVDAAQQGRFPTQTLGAGLTATTHAVFWVDDGTIYPDYPIVDARGAVDVCEACRILIEEFGDVFDFVALHNIDVLDEVPDCGCLAFFVSTQNDVEGIGSSIFNNNGDPFVLGGTSFNTFSESKLEGIIWSNQIDGAPLSHEVMHHWAARAAASLGWLDGAGHFTQFTTVNGIMDNPLLEPGGGFVSLDAAPRAFVDLVANGDGTFRIVSRPGSFNATFSESARYLAGFLPASQVDVVQLLSGSIDPSDQNAVTATTVTDISVDDVIAIEGPRVPSSATSPKDFRVGTLVISDDAFSEAEYAFVTLMLRYWESDKAYDGEGPPPWTAATLGVSTITLELPLVFPSDPATIVLEAEQTTVVLEREIAIAATVSDDAGVPVPAVQVQFSEQFSAATVTAEVQETDSDGRVSATFSSAEAGEATVTATVVTLEGGVVVQTALTASTTITVIVPPVTRIETLQPLWNLVGWTGDDSPIETVTSEILGSIGGFFIWDRGFLGFNPDLPLSLNQLQVVPHGAGVWTFVSSATPLAWEQPAFTDARSVALTAGFNLVMWTGPDGTPIAEAIADLAGVRSLFLWNAATQGFASFNTSLPPALNTASELNHGDGIWVLMSAAGTWDQPAS